MALTFDQNNNTWSRALWKNMVEKDFGLKALHLAAKQGHEGVVGRLIKTGDSINEPTNEGRTALCIAAYGGHHGVAVILCNNKADVDQCCRNGWTSLMSASLQGHLDVTKLLFQFNVNVNASTSCGYTALMIASENGHLEVLDHLIGEKAQIGAKTVSPCGQMQSKQMVKMDTGLVPKFSMVNDLHYNVNVNIGKAQTVHIP